MLGAASLELLLAKTTTGFLLIGILALVYWLAAPKTKDQFIFLGIIALLGVAVAYVAVPSIHSLLNTWIFQRVVRITVLVAQLL